jgi:hypothetical protein
MSQTSWVVTLTNAHERPAMFQGDMVTGHLTMGIRAPLELLYEMRGFEEPQRAIIAVSPAQYHVKCASGPLIYELDRLVEWDQCDSLFGAIIQSTRKLGEIPEAWVRRFYGPTHCWAAFTSLLFLAPRGAMAIRTGDGLWCQIYEQGWPKTPPFRVKGADISTGLMITAALSREWCSDLPYTLEAAERIIPKAARPFVRVEWHPKDDLLPACIPDPGCAMHAENIGRWL